MLTVSTIDQDLGMTAFLTSYRALTLANIAVGVGIFDSPKMALVAATNEFGLAGHSERSFLRSTADENQDKYAQLLGRALSKIVDDFGRAELELRLIGEIAVRDVQKKIIDIKFPPNSPQTIKRKGSNNPLIDTGGMLRAQSFKVYL